MPDKTPLESVDTVELWLLLTVLSSLKAKEKAEAEQLKNANR